MVRNTGPYAPDVWGGEQIGQISLQSVIRSGAVPNTVQIEAVFCERGAGRESGTIRNGKPWHNAITGEKMPEEGVVHVALLQSAYDTPFVLLPAFPHQKEELIQKVQKFMHKVDGKQLSGMFAKAFWQLLKQENLHV